MDAVRSRLLKSGVGSKVIPSSAALISVMVPEKVYELDGVFNSTALPSS